ncbi:hypothetical protein RIB2604_02113280 [Aspergillus luchuensis]|nr:hypothetical protein ALUC_20298S [Aspergillus luchuensis]GAT27634.1 hypothetical protein RIB2604_02113280 [Aspergillus luchuensis]
MDWTELNKVAIVAGLICFAFVLKNEAPKLREWYRKLQEARAAQPGAPVFQQLAVIRSPPPALLPIHSHSTIELNFWENQGALGEGTRLEDSGSGEIGCGMEMTHSGSCVHFSLAWELASFLSGWRSLGTPTGDESTLLRRAGD